MIKIAKKQRRPMNDLDFMICKFALRNYTFTQADIAKELGISAYRVSLAFNGISYIDRRDRREYFKLRRQENV